ncbi:MAG TPA: cytochrome c oxidase assembly protein [Candidatus Sulfotelmatobacter sp.]|nr:cytochrome c oxidase assembly protein [Candidatus Sulfotelmatobacter sp.]
MSPAQHAAMGSLPVSPAILIAAIALVCLLFLAGCHRARRAFANGIPVWREASFILGVFLVWAALGSPFADFDHDLLTFHMIQHLLLMTFAPALILLGEPLLALKYGLPRFAHALRDGISRRPSAQHLGHALSQPASCWIISTVTLMGWHVPALFTLAMRSSAWHTAEQVSFFGAGFLFWWPVIQPWPSVSTGPRWSTLLYLFFATLPCDALSGFLVFSDRVAYPAYFSMPRHFGLSVLEDQQLAAALMWTCVTLVYLIPAAIVSVQLLSPRSLSRNAAVQSELLREREAQGDSPRWETV